MIYPAGSFRLREGSRFMGSASRPEQAVALIIGAPMDATTSFYPGARFAPAKIRGVSYVLEEYSPLLDRSLEDVVFYDAGDIELPVGNVARLLQAIGAVVHEYVLPTGKQLFLLGGEHLVSLPVIEAFSRAHPGLAVVHLDAHADLRDTYEGTGHSHATVMRRVAECVGPQNVYQFGIRSGTRAEFAYGRGNTHFHPYEVLEPIQGVVNQLHDRPVYVTLDIDVIDPGFAPGTGTPEPGGCAPQEVIAALHVLRAARVVGFDLVEVCPLADQGVTTSVLAAKLLREAILSFCGDGATPAR